MQQRMEQLGQAAGLDGICVNVLAGGMDPARALALAPLTQSTGGSLTLHDTWSQQMTENLVLTLGQRQGLTCTLSLRTSPGLALADTFGALLPLYAAGQPTEEWPGVMGHDAPPPRTWLYHRSWHFYSPPPDGSAGLTLLLESEGTIAQQQHQQVQQAPPPYFYLQAAFAWTTGDGTTQRHRVITRRLHTSRSPTSVVEALDPAVAGVVWGKELVAAALQQGTAFDRKGAEVLRRSIGEQNG